MAKPGPLARIALSPMLCMALDRLMAFSGAYQIRTPYEGGVSPSYLIVGASLLAVVLIAFRIPRFREMPRTALAHLAFVLFVASMVPSTLPQAGGIAVLDEICRACAQISLLLFLVAAIQPLSSLNMVESIKVLALAACVSCASVPLGYFSLLTGEAVWLKAIAAVLALGCWLSLIRSRNFPVEPERPSPDPSFAQSFSGLLCPLVCYIGANFFLNTLRRSLFEETGASLLPDLIPPLGIVVGSIALLVYWRHELVLFKISPRFPLFTTLLAFLFATLPFMPFGYHALVLFVVSSLYEALYLILIAACIELKRHCNVSILLSWSFSMFVYRAAWPLGDILANAASGAFGDTFSRLCCMSIAALLLLLLFNSLRIFLASRSGALEHTLGSPGPLAPRSDSEKAPVRSSLRTCPALVERARISPREMDVLELVVRARTASRIADELFVSENTVKAHMKSIYSKLGVHSRQELLDAIDKALGQEPG